MTMKVSPIAVRITPQERSANKILTYWSATNPCSAPFTN